MSSFSLAFLVILPVCLVAKSFMGTSTVDCTPQGKRGRLADTVTELLQNQMRSDLFQPWLDCNFYGQQDAISGDEVFLAIVG